MTRKSRLALIILFGAASVVLVFSFMVFMGTPQGLRTSVYWLLGSRHYKQDVLASHQISTELLHAEWQGDGWGGVPVGDWVGYVVFDPNDSLPITSTDQLPVRIQGIGCDVVAVRRLEKTGTPSLPT